MVKLTVGEKVDRVDLDKPTTQIFVYKAKIRKANQDQLNRVHITMEV